MAALQANNRYIYWRRRQAGLSLANLACHYTCKERRKMETAIILINAILLIRLVFLLMRKRANDEEILLLALFVGLSTVVFILYIMVL